MYQLDYLSALQLKQLHLPFTIALSLNSNLFLFVCLFVFAERAFPLRKDPYNGCHFAWPQKSFQLFRFTQMEARLEPDD